MSALKKILSIVLSLMIAIGTIAISATDLKASAISESEVVSKLNSLYNQYPAGTRWTSTFDGAIQCYGFAGMIIYNIFGKYSSSRYRWWNYSGYSTSGMNTIGSTSYYSYNNVKDLIVQAKPGDVLQFDENNQHSMIVWSVDSDGFTVYDCNRAGSYLVSRRKFGFGDFSGWNSKKLTLLRSDNYDLINYVHYVDPSYSTNFSAYLKDPDTNHYVFNNNHTNTGGYINDVDPVTIHEVYTDGCCKLSYTTSSGTTKTAYGKIDWFTFGPKRNTDIQGWLGDENGNEISDIMMGDRVYLWYKIYDSNTGDLYNSYGSGQYSVKETFFDPKGNEVYTTTYQNSDINWISHVAVGYDYGNCSWKVELTWNDGSGYTCCNDSYNVGCNATLSVDSSSLSLTMGNKKTGTLNYTKEGIWPENCTDEFVYDHNIISLTSNGDNSWTVTALSGGTTDLWMMVKCGNETIRSVKTVVSVRELDPAPYWGDLNGDKIADFSDMLIINKYRNGSTTLTDEQMIIADVDFDGDVDFDDMTTINQLRLGNIEEMPAQSSSAIYLNRYNGLKTTYVKGQPLEFDELPITIYNLDSVDEIYYDVYDYNISGYNPQKLGEQEVQIEWRDLVFTITVTVIEDSIDSISIKTLPSRTNYYVGDSLSASGLTLTATYLSGKTETISSGFNYTPSILYDVGNKEVTVFYANRTTSFNVNVSEDAVNTISVKTMPSKTTYYEGDALKTTGLTLTATYASGRTETVSSGFTCSPSNLNTAGTQKITVTYLNKTASFNVTVNEDYVVSISVKTKPGKLTYYVGDVLNPTGLTLTAAYASGKTETVTTGYTCTPMTFNTSGSQVVTVSYAGKTTSFSVYVLEETIQSISIKTTPNKVSYFQGDTLDTTGLTLTATYASGKTDIVTSGFSCSPTNLNSAGTQKITVSYAGKTTSFNVNVSEDTVKSISVKTKPSKTTYYKGDTLNASGLALTATYASGKTETIASGFTCSPTILNTVGTQKITVTYAGETTTFDVTVKNDVVKTLEVKTPPAKTDYTVGDVLDTTGLVLKYTTESGLVAYIDEGFTCSPTKLNNIGNQIITVTFGEKSTSFTVTVSNTPINSHTITFLVDGDEYSKTTYETGAGIQLPTSPSKTGFKFIKWEPSVPANMPDNDIIVIASFEAIKYTAVFIADGITIGTVSFTVESTSLNEPPVPTKEGYVGNWSDYTLTAADITIYAVYTKTEDDHTHSDSNDDGKCDGCGEILDPTKYENYVVSNATVNVGQSRTVDYRAKVTVIATASNIPEGFYLAIFDGNNLCAKGDNETVTYFAGEMKADRLFTVKIVDADGNPKGNNFQKNVKVSVNTSLFAKIIAFFKGLFGMLPNVEIKP